jgi:hypothetical protein
MKRRCKAKCRWEAFTRKAGFDRGLYPSPTTEHPLARGLLHAVVAGDEIGEINVDPVYVRGLRMDQELQPLERTTGQGGIIGVQLTVRARLG